MKALILSCNTGEGHNSAGKAIKEALEKAGHQVVMLDYMRLAGDRVSDCVGGVYINVAKYAPHLFGFVYKLGLWISSDRRKSPVYYANARMAKTLQKYLSENHYDVIVMPHLYPAETLTYMKNHNMLTENIPMISVGTDYTCIPFWEETDCDAYVIPHQDCAKEYISRGIPKEKLYPYGIPVKQVFGRQCNKARLNCLRKKLGIKEKEKVFLVMSGSMGFGKIQIFTKQLNSRCRNGQHIIVICGNNNRLKKVLKRRFGKKRHIHIIGFTNHVADYMDISDVVYTKPGGLTSTEVMVKNRPMVHTAPIPGCETENVRFFTERGMSVYAHRIRQQIELGFTLAENETESEIMLGNQAVYGKPAAADDIIELMKKLSGKS